MHTAPGCPFRLQCRSVSGLFSMNSQRAPDTQSVYSITSGKNLVAIKTKAGCYRRNKTCIIVGLVTLFFISLMIALILHTRKRIRTYYIEKSILCDTEECMKIAASLKESMDMTVDPCDDFHKYVCGRWTKEHPVPETRATYSWFDERHTRVTRTLRDLFEQNFTDVNKVPRAVQQTKVLYKSCMDVDTINELGLAPIFELLEKLGLPHTPAAITHETTDIIPLLANVKREFMLEVFIGIDVYPDPRNSRKNIIMIGAPERDNPFAGDKRHGQRSRKTRRRNSKHEDTSEKDDPDEDLLEKMYIHDVMREILTNGTAEYRMCKFDSTEPDEEIFSVAEKIFDLEETLDEFDRYIDNATDPMDEVQEDDYMYVDELQKLTDDFVREGNSTKETIKIWKPFIEALFQDILKVGWHQRYKLLVLDIEYLKRIALMLVENEEEILESSLWWNVVDTLVPYSTDSLRRILTAYVEKVAGHENPESRSLQCAMKVNRFMGLAVAWLFVDPKFHKHEGVKVHTMLSLIQRAFGELIYEADWMDQLTKIATERKVMKIKPIVGYPEYLFNEGILDEIYDNIELDEGEYLINMAELLHEKMNMELMKIKKINNFNDPIWVSGPVEVNAYYTFFSNQITIPAGILQFPFYDLGLTALNFGALGSILGHELTHGFDNFGRQYDTEGNKKQWWTNETIVKYINRTQCFIDHYSSYFVEELNEYVDGELTLSENIADNGGLRQAYYAYITWVEEQDTPDLYLPGFTNFTNEQMFFLGFAHTWCGGHSANALHSMIRDTHSPGNIRLLATLKNSVEFNRVWACPVNSRMNIEEKCRIW